MIRILVPALLILTVCYACSKDKYKTKPSLEVLDESSIVPRDGQIYVRLKFTDKEGDIARDSIWYLPELLNVRRPVGPREYIPVKDPLPDFPDKSSGEIELRLDHFLYYKEIADNTPGHDKNDTIRIRFVLQDRAGNTSDTAISGQIVLLDQ
ncbi:hypothetical protein [Flavihumibacter solisilvae]|uniref:DUF5007 domain-containing protein n=1 Tax=Flavihumibacter solisilvae TaxID=1349421 RepID=A0A0C1IH08_9BACT|nr:hypothetical protein [Flavihumibacter solisilvae]KIC93470.1 hypothetical protein OI18_17065 [Flavihumibacter solisilvae]